MRKTCVRQAVFDEWFPLPLRRVRRPAGRREHRLVPQGLADPRWRQGVVREELLGRVTILIPIIII